MPSPDGATQVLASISRFSALDVNGFPAVGSQVFVTDQMLKATFTPVMETGVDLVTINAGGNIAQHYKHGDMPKYFTMAISLSSPDPILKAILTGGTVLTDSSTALGAVTGTPVATSQTTLGSLPAGNWGYRVTQYNQYGETAASSEFVATTTGSTAANVLSGWTTAATAFGSRIYGRFQGAEQLIGTLANIGTASTSAASGTGSVSTLTVTALTAAIPQGFTFQIAGDTNTTKIVFTVTAPAAVGSTHLLVSVSQTITTTIAAAALVPVFVDTGATVPNGAFPTTDTTAGPGNDTGYQAPALGVVGNPLGVSCEFWGLAIKNGSQVSSLPYWRWAVPRVTGLHDEARTFQPNILENNYTGQSNENPNWGSGPFGDWNFDSSKAYQYIRCGAQGLPVPGLSPVLAST